jgi:hypothetical protein
MQIFDPGRVEFQVFLKLQRRHLPQQRVLVKRELGCRVLVEFVVYEDSCCRPVARQADFDSVKLRETLLLVAPVLALPVAILRTPIAFLRKSGAFFIFRRLSRLS